MKKFVSLTLALSCLCIAACDSNDGAEGPAMSKAAAA